MLTRKSGVNMPISLGKNRGTFRDENQVIVPPFVNRCMWQSVSLPFRLVSSPFHFQLVLNCSIPPCPLSQLVILDKGNTRIFWKCPHSPRLRVKYIFKHFDDGSNFIQVPFVSGTTREDPGLRTSYLWGQCDDTRANNLYYPCGGAEATRAGLHSEWLASSPL